MRVRSAQGRWLARSVGPLALFLMMVLAPARSSAVGGTAFRVAIDEKLGYVTAENEVLKVVWRHAANAAEHFNQSGGNIYELYDKRTDPDMARNIVGVANEPQSTGGTHPMRPGYGGLGSTKVYYSPRPGEYRSIADNAERARLDEWSTSSVDARGAMGVSYQFRMQGDDGLVYGLRKSWTLDTDGTIALRYEWQFPRDLPISEPSYNFSFNPDYGWTAVDHFRHDWRLDDPDGPGISDPRNRWVRYPVGVDQPDRDFGGLHGQVYHLVPEPGRSAVTVAIDNDGRGFEGGGLFHLGFASYGRSFDAMTTEFSRYRRAAFGYVVRWHAWWAGENWLSHPERYRLVRGGTALQDSFMIRIGQPPT